jgi:hypothetical protein
VQCRLARSPNVTPYTVRALWTAATDRRATFRNMEFGGVLLRTTRHLKQSGAVEVSGSQWDLNQIWPDLPTDAHWQTH